MPLNTASDGEEEEEEEEESDDEDEEEEDEPTPATLQLGGGRGGRGGRGRGGGHGGDQGTSGRGGRGGRGSKRKAGDMGSPDGGGPGPGPGAAVIETHHRNNLMIDYMGSAAVRHEPLMDAVVKAGPAKYYPKTLNPS